MVKCSTLLWQKSFTFWLKRMYFPVSAADVLRECAVLHRNRVLPRLFLPDVLRLRAVTHEYALRSGICCIHVPRQTKSDAGNEN